MDVFLMIRRGNTTIFMDAKESTTVLDLKKMLQGITKKAPEDMRLFKEDLGSDGNPMSTFEKPLEDNKNLGDSGFTSSTARAQAPATIGMTFRAEGEGAEFEELAINALSTPPELPDVMKPQESGSSHGTEQVQS